MGLVKQSKSLFHAICTEFRRISLRIVIDLPCRQQVPQTERMAAPGAIRMQPFACLKRRPWARKLSKPSTGRSSRVRAAGSWSHTVAVPARKSNHLHRPAGTSRG